MMYLVTAVRDLTESCAVYIEASSIEESIDAAHEKINHPDFTGSWSIDVHAVNHVTFFSNPIDKSAIGAECTIRFMNDAREEQVYISFGAFTEHHQDDGFGVVDDHIFYYASAGESELKELMHDSVEGFVVLHYELIFDWPTLNMYGNNGRLIPQKRFRVAVSNLKTGECSVLVDVDNDQVEREQAIKILAEYDFDRT